MILAAAQASPSFFIQNVQQQPQLLRFWKSYTKMTRKMPFREFLKKLFY